MRLKDYLTHKQECNRNKQEQYNEWWLAIQDIEDPNQRDEQLKQYREERAKCDCGLNDALNKAENLPISEVRESFSPIDKNDPTFEILFRDGNWSAYDSQLTDMMREMVIRYNKLVEYLNAQ